MPELPEVETIRTKLALLILGKTIQSVNIYKSKSFHGNVGHIENSSISDVKRRAKILQFHLSNGLFVLVHLKMTGQLIYTDETHRVGGGHPTADWVKNLPSSHTRVSIHFDDSSQLFFNDMRIFGWLKVVDEGGLEREFEEYGPDINDANLTAPYLQNQFLRRTIPIKQAMMLNQIVAGLGNIYVCDALNAAQVNPLRPAQSLTLEEIERLLKASQAVIAKGIELGGATIDDYVDVAGFSGKYQDVVRVYGRAGEKCLNCGSLIQKIKLGGRGTYFCPQCQR